MAQPTSGLEKCDFDDAAWEAVAAASAKKECFEYARLFVAKMQEAERARDEKTREVFQVLADIAGMSFHLDTPWQPFWPFALVDRISDQYLDILSDVANGAQEPDMRARIADILWVRRRNHRMARLAVDSYLESATILEDSAWWVACATRYQRALQVAAQFNFRKDAFNKVIERIKELVERLNGDDPLFLSTRLMELLQEHGEGDAAKYAALAEKAARRAAGNGAWHVAEACWTVSASWHQQMGGAAEERAAWSNLAEMYVKQAEAAASAPKPSHSLASTHLQTAIEVYRNKVGNSQVRIDELRHQLLAYQRLIKQELTPLGGGYDPTELIEIARKRVEGKSVYEALRSLGLLGSPHVPQSKGALRQLVQEMSKQFVVSQLFAVTLITDDGRVTARKPSMLSSDPKEVEEAIEADMFHWARVGQMVHAQAMIEPARSQIILEHNVTLHDFSPFVRNNPFIPPGHEGIYARGLHAGLTGDLVTAVHLLAPQLENSVRTALQRRGLITSNLTTQGIQDEFNLNKIFEQHSADVEDVFGSDLAFDLRGILVERFGSNIRNDTAHGLLPESNFSSAAMLYLWWLALHICCRVLHLDWQHSPEVEEAKSNVASEEIGTGCVSADHSEKI